MLVYITRHGQPRLTPEDSADPDYPRHDPPLSELGHRQALALGARLAELGFAGTIHSSPYRRTAETAQCIAEVLGTCFRLATAIREIVKREEQMHGFCGMDLQALRAEFPALAPDASLPYPWWTRAAETGPDVLARVAPFLDRLLMPESAGDVLLVGHGASVQAATRYLMERCASTPDEVPLSWNCALTGFRLTETWEVLHLRDTSHLPHDLVTSNARRKGEEQPAGETAEADGDSPSDDGHPTRQAVKCTSIR